MIRLNEELLNELQLAFLPAAQKNAMLRAIYDELEIRVGMRLASEMSNRQLDEFGKLIDAHDKEGALAWLKVNSPHYRAVVQHEFETIQTELRSLTTEIRSASIAYGP